jgi:hypothetical protein
MIVDQSQERLSERELVEVFIAALQAVAQPPRRRSRSLGLVGAAAPSPREQRRPGSRSRLPLIADARS